MTFFNNYDNRIHVCACVYIICTEKVDYILISYIEFVIVKTKTETVWYNFIIIIL